MKLFCILFFGVSTLVSIGQQSNIKAIESSTVQKIDLLKMPNQTITSVLPNQYMQSLGFFCKQEIQLQKQTIIPIKVRLGTQQSCDHIEAK